MIHVGSLWSITDGTGSGSSSRTQVRPIRHGLNTRGHHRRRHWYTTVLFIAFELFR